MQIAMGRRRLVASILVIGLFAAALTFTCSEGIHMLYFGSLSGRCAGMTHSDGIAATVDSESGAALMSQLFTLAAGFAVFVFSVRSSPRLVPVSPSPSHPPDPRFGALRI